MIKAGITEKRLTNKRFKKTEEAILRVFFEEENYVGVSRMAKQAGVARSTIYQHHRVVRNIVLDYENYILIKYRKMIGRAMRTKGVSNKSLYGKMLIFILQNRQIFKMFVKSGRRDVFIKMLFIMRSKIESINKLPKNSGKIFEIYAGEVTTLIMRWGRGGFRENESERLLADILHLMVTVRNRLAPLLD